MSDAEPAGRAALATASILGALERRTGLTPTGVAAAGLVALAWLAAYLIGSQVLFLMSYGTAGLLIALTLAGRRSLPVHAKRSKIPHRMREAQTFAVEVDVTARRRTGTMILEESLDRLRSPVRLLVTSLAPNAPVTHQYQVTPALRGVYRVGPLMGIWTDPFGLTRKRTVLAEAVDVLVHPAVEPVHDRVLSREWEDPPVRPPISKPWPTGFEFYGMRDYVAGDDPRRIVWRAVARSGRYLVREAEQGITDRAVIVLDTFERSHAAGTPSETFESAVRAVASLGVLHLRDGFVVTVETPAAPLAGPLRGPAARIALLDALARAERERVPLTDGLRRLVGSRRRDTHYIIVTPRLDRQTAQTLRLLLAGGSSATFVHVAGEDPDARSLEHAASLGCEVVELPAGAALEAVFRRGTGAGIRR